MNPTSQVSSLHGSNSSTRRLLWSVVVLLLLCIAGFFGWQRYTLAQDGQQEAQAQAPEIAACQKRLGQFYQAWSAYKRDHKGSDPGSYADLVPRYIKDPDMLVCPTAKRYFNRHQFMEAGTLKVNGKDYLVTYGFRAFTSSFPRAVKKFGDRATIVACNAHEDGMYRAVYHKAPSAGVLDPAERGSLTDEVKKARLLVLRKNGAVEEIDPATDN